MNEYVLLAVKVIGLLIGAGAGIYEISRKDSSEKSARVAIAFVVAGLGAAVVAEVFDALVRRRAAEETIVQNTKLLQEVRRGIHPLFPMFVEVRFHTPLDTDVTRTTRTRLEAALQRIKASRP